LVRRSIAARTVCPRAPQPSYQSAIYSKPPGPYQRTVAKWRPYTGEPKKTGGGGVRLNRKLHKARLLQNCQKNVKNGNFIYYISKKNQMQQNIELLSYLKFDYTVDAFKNQYKPDALWQGIALGFKFEAQDERPSPSVLIYTTLGELEENKFESEVSFLLSAKSLAELAEYIETHPTLTLLHAILGVAKNAQGKTDTVVMMMASDDDSATYLLYKGERVGKNGKVSFLKGGERVSIVVHE